MARSFPESFSANPTINSSYALNTIGSFIQTNGGAISLARGGGGSVSTSAAGIKGASSIGRFVSNISSRGFDEAISELNIDSLDGLSTHEVIATLADELSESANTGDDSDARNAQTDLWEELIKQSPQTQDIAQILTDIAQNDKLESLLENTLVIIYIINFAVLIFKVFLRKLETKM